MPDPIKPDPSSTPAASIAPYVINPRTPPISEQTGPSEALAATIAGMNAPLPMVPQSLPGHVSTDEALKKFSGSNVFAPHVITGT